MSALREVVVPGLGSRYFPADAPDEQVMASINNELHTYNESDIGLGQRALIAAGRGIVGFNEGAQQFGSEILSPIIGDQNYKDFTAQGMARQKEYANTENAGTFAGKVGEFVGGALPYLALGPVGAARGLLGQAAIGAAITGTSFVPEGGSRLGQAALGAVINPAVGAGARALAKPFVKAWNARQGNYKPSVDKGTIEDFKRAGVRPLASDVDSSQSVQRMHSVASRFPVGMPEERIAQAEALKKTAETEVAAAAAAAKKAPYLSAEEMAQVKAASIDPKAKRYNESKNLLEEISATPENDMLNVVNTGGSAEVLRRRMLADKGYTVAGQLSDLAAPAEAKPFLEQLQKTHKYFSNMKTASPAKTTIKNIYNDAFPKAPPPPQIPLPPASAFKRVGLPSGAVRYFPKEMPGEQIYESLSKEMAGKTKGFGTVEEAQLALQRQQQRLANQSETAPQPKRLSVSELHELKGILLEQQQLYRKGPNAVIGKRGEGMVAALVNSARESSAEHAATSAEAKAAHDAYVTTDLFYEKQVSPYIDAQMARGMHSKNQDSLYQSYMKRGEKEGSQKLLYEALGTKGRAAAAAKALNDSYTKAYDPQTGIFSVKTFVNDLNSQAGSLRTFLNSKMKKSINGLSNIGKHIGSSYIPTNGAINFPVVASSAASALAGTIMGGPAGAVAGALAPISVAKLMHFALTNPSAQKFVWASAKLAPKSKGMDAVLRSLVNLMQTGATQTSKDRANK